MGPGVKAGTDDSELHALSIAFYAAQIDFGSAQTLAVEVHLQLLNKG